MDGCVEDGGKRMGQTGEEKRVRPKRIRSYFSPYQTKSMEVTYESNPFPDKDAIVKLSSLLDISERSLQVWFQNRRARQRKTNPSVDKDLIKSRTDRLLSVDEAMGTPMFDVHLANKYYPYEAHQQSLQQATDLGSHQMNGQDDSDNDKSPSPVHGKKRTDFLQNWHKPQLTNVTESGADTTPRVDGRHRVHRQQSEAFSPARQTSLKEHIFTSPGKNATDEFCFMQMDYASSTDNVLDMSSSSNKTSSLKSRREAADSSFEEAHPFDTAMNLCTRDTCEKDSPKPKKARTTSPTSCFNIYPNWHYALQMYGYPPGMPYLPPFHMPSFYPAMFPMTHLPQRDEHSINALQYMPQFAHQPDQLPIKGENTD